MTDEEAAQVILERKPWVTCWRCNGTGMGFLYRAVAHGGTFDSEHVKEEIDYRDHCLGCKGSGFARNHRHVIAMLLLGLDSIDMPPMPPIKFYSRASIVTFSMRRLTRVVIIGLYPSETSFDEEWELLNRYHRQTKLPSRRI